MSQSGPITAALEEEVTRALRQRGMVVWLDKDGHYTTYVDALVERHTRGAFFAPGA
jgi:Cys-tRNA synthase (O-phospho-L-seryl-tRNA:Cys-tRNA synthase)